MRIITLVCLTGIVASTSASVVAQDITAADLLKRYTPRTRGIDVETPKAADFEKCTREVVREGKGSSWVVYGPAGQVLRRFADTDGDQKVDQFRFYKLGVEVYRDIDSDGDEVIDQFRWLNRGGTRWGLDANADGRIDEWKRLSAQEAAEVAVTSMINGDARLLQSVLLSEKDIRTLGLTGTFAASAKESVSDVATKMKKAVGTSKTLGRSAKWMRFDAQSPALIPSGNVSNRDIVVYEDAMGMVDVAGDTALVYVGELVKVGDVWKLTTIPQPADDKQIPSVSVLMRPELRNPGNMAGPVNPVLVKLEGELRDHDKTAPGPTSPPRKIAAYNKKRAEILLKLMEAADTADKKDEYTRQFADGIAVAVPGIPGGWKEGQQLLEKLEKQIAADSRRSKSDIYSYVVYRRILAENGVRLETAAVADRQEVQEWFLDQLEIFAKKYPKVPDAAEALFELAKNQEFLGKVDEAEQSYKKLERAHPKSIAGKVAAGARRRLSLEGKVIKLSGTDIKGRKIDIAQYKGRVTLVVFWTTWCRPCTAELPRLKQLHAKYQRNGFEILGVNLDSPGAPIDAYLRQHKPTWNHLKDPQGMQGPLGQEFGIISVPTMFLVDKAGKVIARTISVGDLAEGLPNVLRGKGLKSDEKKAVPRNARKRK
ncbi:MAG: redoxin domain-containing protein [Planctomycetaceae bacterium]